MNQEEILEKYKKLTADHIDRDKIGKAIIFTNAMKRLISASKEVEEALYPISKLYNGGISEFKEECASHGIEPDMPIDMRPEEIVRLCELSSDAAQKVKEVADAVYENLSKDLV